MFGRVLWKLLRASRGRLVVALIALVSGAAVISALLNLEMDIERKLTMEFRTLGANLVIAPGRDVQAIESGAESPTLMDQSVVLMQVERMKTPDVLAAAPYLYIVAQAAGSPVVVAGTWLDQARKLAPTWKLEGEWVASREDETRCLIGQNVARQFKLAPGSLIELRYLGRTARMTVAGILSSGGTEDSHVFVNLPVAQQLAGLSEQIGLVQISVSGTSKSIEAYTQQLAASLRGFEVRPIRQVSQAEGELLNRIRLLIVSMVILILVLTALCVLATMAALAMERREDVGLMKALGGSISRVVGLFLAEVGA